MTFSNGVRSEAALRELMGGPVAPPVVEKTMTSLDRHCFAFIGRAFIERGAAWTIARRWRAIRTVPDRRGGRVEIGRLLASRSRHTPACIRALMDPTCNSP